MLNERDRAMLDELERNKNVKQTQRRNRQGGWSMTGNAERALAGGALLKIDVEVNRLSECQTNHEEKAEQHPPNSCGSVFWLLLLKCGITQLAAITPVQNRDNLKNRGKEKYIPRWTGFGKAFTPQTNGPRLQPPDSQEDGWKGNWNRDKSHRSSAASASAKSR